MKETKKNGAAQSKAGKRDYSAFKNMYRKIPQDLRDVIVYYIGDRPLVIHEGVNEVTGEVVTAEFIRQWHMDRDREVYNNEKYAMRCWMLRLGFIGDEFATAREILLRNMEGNASWRNK